MTGDGGPPTPRALGPRPTSPLNPFVVLVVEHIPSGVLVPFVQQVERVRIGLLVVHEDMMPHWPYQRADVAVSPARLPRAGRAVAAAHPPTRNERSGSGRGEMYGEVNLDMDTRLKLAAVAVPGPRAPDSQAAQSTVENS